jgi:hypothetical protein
MFGKAAEPVELAMAAHDGQPRDDITVLDLKLLHHHTYLIRISVENHVGLTHSCMTSQVTIDTTPPDAGVVLILQHDEDNEVAMPTASHYQYSTKILRISTRNFADAESGILGYMATVYRSDGWLILPEVWVGSREFMTVAVDMIDRQSFYAVIRAINMAELSTSVHSTTVTIDATPPMIDFVRDIVPSTIPNLVGATMWTWSPRQRWSWEPCSELEILSRASGSQSGASGPSPVRAMLCVLAALTLNLVRRTSRLAGSSMASITSLCSYFKTTPATGKWALRTASGLTSVLRTAAQSMMALGTTDNLLGRQ